MSRKQSKHGLARVWPALGVVAIVAAVLTGGVGGLAAEPAAQAGTNSDATVVLDDSSLWRQFLVSRCFYVRTADGKLEPWAFVLDSSSSKDWLHMRFEPAASTVPWRFPPEEWVSPSFDDSVWPRVRLPQPVPIGRRQHMQGGFPAALLVRGKFEVKDPAQVKSCRLSLNYWGGVVAYINGKEAARGHMQTNRTPQEAIAEDYPAEAWTTPKGKPLLSADKENADRLALRDRKLEVEIPTALLRQGLNILAIQVAAAPMDSRAFNKQGYDWLPVGLLSARLTESSPGVAAPHVQRPPGLQVWNCESYETVTVFDYGDPPGPLRPVLIHAARNSVFSGRLMVGSMQPIQGLKVSATDLTKTGGGKLLSTAVRVRCAVVAEPGKSWMAGHRFDGLLDVIPSVIPVAGGLSQDEIEHPEHRFFHWRYDRNMRFGIPGAVAPLWFTVRVPKDTDPGLYEGTAIITAEGLPPTDVPLRVSVSEWTAPDPRDFRVHNFAHHSEDAVALHYGVPRWSDKHFELMGKSLALMAEVGSRQVYANLSVEYFGNRWMPSNAESLVRWIRQPDGSYKHDFTVFDKYLDMVARYVGEPFPLQLNCWGELPGPGKAREGSWQGWGGVKGVTLLDPATGKTECMAQPALGTEESYEFWRPVFDGILMRLKARGWLKVTALEWNTVYGGVPEDVKDIARKLWPDGVWSLTCHDALGKDELFLNGVYSAGMPFVRGYRELLKPRRSFTSFWGGSFGHGAPLADCRGIIEDMIMSGHDGLGRYGADLFPVKNAQGKYSYMACGWPRNPRDLMGLALIYPGPDGPVATERYEMFREGVELGEALLFIERAIEEKKLGPALQQRAEKHLEDRSNAFVKNWFVTSGMPSPEEDANLLDLAGEVARGMGKK